jgi:hypothetical protein
MMDGEVLKEDGSVRIIVILDSVSRCNEQTQSLETPNFLANRSRVDHKSLPSRVPLKPLSDRRNSDNL